MAAIAGGMGRLTAQLNRVGLAFTSDDLLAGAVVILSEAQDNCPVDTGFLQSTGFIEQSGDDVLIGFAAEYASFVEFGTYKMAAQPFLRPAFDNMEDEALSAIVDSVTARLPSVIG